MPPKCSLILGAQYTTVCVLCCFYRIRTKVVELKPDQPGWPIFSYYSQFLQLCRQQRPTTVHYPMLPCTTLSCRALPNAAVHYPMLPCTTLCCRALPNATVYYPIPLGLGTLCSKIEPLCYAPMLKNHTCDQPCGKNCSSQQTISYVSLCRGQYKFMAFSVPEDSSIVAVDGTTEST